MKFVDQTRIRAVSGDGGRGCLSFRREAFVPKGGPDGGDGGKGGDVIIRADASLHTLLDCQYQQLYKAKRGAHGMGKDRHGRSAPPLIVRVPVGTLVHDEETQELIADLDRPGKEVLVAVGGRGGRGNARFVSSRNRAPRRFEGGQPGVERSLRLELKLIADVGLIGLPNAGKSTLISRVSNARPKIADYPFTTKVPGLGIVRIGDGFDFVMADIPGLIKDAHKGAGMGDRFLRHIERTRLLLHLVDPSPHLDNGPEERFDIVMNELTSYRVDLVRKPLLAVITKTDLPENREPADELRAALERRGFEVYAISAATGSGLKELLRGIVRLLKRGRSES
ncbi:MAG: GTPase ObgE [Desulfomonilaceae bacterium]|nr:GTPase ObgE [Desulfomonilaceae bacterium]